MHATTASATARAMGWFSGLVWCSAGVGSLGLTFGAMLYVFQDKLLYIPSVPIRDPDDNPAGKCLFVHFAPQRNCSVATGSRFLVVFPCVSRRMYRQGQQQVCVWNSGSARVETTIIS